MSSKSGNSNGFTKDSAIIPPITISIPMPEGAAVPADAQIVPVQSSASGPTQSEQNPK
jgi:hypothetical protein